MSLVDGEGRAAFKQPSRGSSRRDSLRYSRPTDIRMRLRRCGIGRLSGLSLR